MQKSNEHLLKITLVGETMPSNDVQSAKDRIYRAIKEKIINLDLKPGDILSDRKLSEELKVSRTPVREALNLLQKENYVRQHSGRGFFVSEISLKNIEDLYDVRMALESASLRHAAKRDVSKHIELMNQLLRHHKDLTKNFKPQGKFFEDAEFHKAFIMMSENQYMLEILELIFERIQMLRNIEGISEERVKAALQQHMKIFECFKKGLYSETEQMLCQHIQDSKNDIVNRIKSRFEMLYFEKVRG